jgi:hypothetical protein
MKPADNNDSVKNDSQTSELDKMKPADNVSTDSIKEDNQTADSDTPVPIKPSDSEEQIIDHSTEGQTGNTNSDDSIMKDSQTESQTENEDDQTENLDTQSVRDSEDQTTGNTVNIRPSDSEEGNLTDNATQ